MQKYKQPYEEQFNRILRLRKILDKYDNADGDFEEAVDAFTNFFIQCYHLRDWLIQSGYDQQLIDAHIKRSRWLSICRDLANTQKHQKITRYTPPNSFVDHGVGVSTPISRHYDPFNQRSRYGVNIWEYHMPLDAIEVADKCLENWRGFLTSRHIKRPDA